jgi:hypothetical protein
MRNPLLAGVLCDDRRRDRERRTGARRRDVVLGFAAHVFVVRVEEPRWPHASEMPTAYTFAGAALGTANASR